MTCSTQQSARTARALFVAATIGSLAACGGGDSSSPAPGPTPSPSFPTSGYYAYGLTAGGTSSQQQLGLQFTHASQPSKSYTIEAPAANLLGLETMDSGSFNAGTKQVAGLQSTNVLYAKGNSYYRASLQANGQAPTSSVLFTADTGLCPDQTQYMDDYQTAANSALVVVFKRTSTSLCTSDGGVNVAVVYPLQSTPVAVSSRAGGLGTLVRSAATGGIGGQLVLRDSGQADFYPDLKASSFVPLAAASSGRAIVASAPDSVLLVTSSGFEVATTSTPRNYQAVTVRSGAASDILVAGTDETGYYVAESLPSSWRLLKITYGGTTTTLATGSGYVQDVVLADSRVLLSISSNSASATASLFGVTKTGGSPTLLVQALANEVVLAVTGSNDYALVNTFNAQTAASSVRILGPAGTAILTYANAFLVGATPLTSKSIYTSRVNASFLYGTGYALPGLLANGQIVYFDTGSAQTTSLGTLSGFGNDTVAVLSNGFSGTFGALAVIRVSGSTAVSTPIYSVDVSRANSLQATAP
jgi:hypothetical protein